MLAEWRPTGHDVIHLWSEIWACGKFNWFWSPQLMKRESRKRQQFCPRECSFSLNVVWTAQASVLIATHKPFKASQKLYSSQNLLKVWEHARHERQRSRHKSAMRNDHTDNIDKATIKSITQSKGWWFEIIWASETTCNGTMLRRVSGR